MKNNETLADSVHAPKRLKQKIRQSLRHSYISTRARFHKDKENKFIRCLYSHYVFDDQQSSFESLIKKLKNIGQFINTGECIELIQGNHPLDGRYFHLSFDDGLACLYRNAVPILLNEGVPAIIFVNSTLPDNNHTSVRKAWETATNYAQPLDVIGWEKLREISNCGIEIGSHTKTHKRLSAISKNASQLEDEIVGCKKRIEMELDKECKYFAWPYGTLNDIDSVSLEKIIEAEFEASFGVYRAPIDPGQTCIHTIPRLHFEVQWPKKHTLFFASGGLEKRGF